MRRYLTSLITEIEIESVEWYYFLPFGLAEFQKFNYTLCWQGMQKQVLLYTMEGV